jgi:hypothetical protein
VHAKGDDEGWETRKKAVSLVNRRRDGAQVQVYEPLVWKSAGGV